MVIKMKKRVCIFFLCLGIVIALSAGGWLALQCVQTTRYYQEANTQAEQNLAAADPSAVAELESELESVLQSNTDLQESLKTVQDKNTALAESEAELQQSYDALTQEMDVDYYRTILESLTEGMNRVEEYIGG